MNNKSDRWKGVKGNLLAKILNSPLRKFEILILGNYRELFFKELKKYIKNGNETIVDLGAGSGYFSFLAANELDKGKVICIDISDKMLNALKVKTEKLKYQEKIEIRKADISSTGLAENSADIIIANFVLHELSDLTKSISEMQRILKPKGRIIFVDFNSEDSFGKLIKLIHKNKDNGPLSLNEFNKLFEDFHFNNIEIKAIKGCIFGIIEK